MRLALEMPLPHAFPEGWEGSPTLRALQVAIAPAGLRVAEDPRADREDVIELAARTLAATRVLPGLGVAATARGVDGGIVRLDGGDPAEPLDVRRLAIGAGRAEAMAGPGRPSAFDPNPDYWTSPAFRDHAGRATLLCRNSDEGDAAARFAALPYLGAAVAAFGEAHGTGAGRAVAHKYVGLGLKEWPVTFAPARELMGELGYAQERFHRGASLLQQVVDMRFEYRFLVVGWHVVGGSWTRPELTADDADPAHAVAGPDGVAIDARPTGDLGPVQSRAVALAHGAFAADALRALRDEVRLGGDFTLDVFLDPGTGRRGIVELNPIGLAGWYAADPDPVVAALGARLAASPAG